MTFRQAWLGRAKDSDKFSVGFLSISIYHINNRERYNYCCLQTAGLTATPSHVSH